MTRPTHPALRPLLLCSLVLSISGCKGCEGGETAQATARSAAAATSEAPAGAEAGAGPAAPEEAASQPTQPANAAPPAEDAADADVLEPSAVGREALPTDVLVVVEAPALDPAALDRALQPTIAALETLAGQRAVYAMSEAGKARLLIRFDEATAHREALARVDTALRAAKTTSLGLIRRAAMARGARIGAAATVIGADGPAAATRWIETNALPRLRAVAGGERVGVAGAVRDVHDLHVLAPALATYGVTAREVGALVSAQLARGGSLEQALEATLPRRNTANGATTRPRIRDLVTSSRGVGEDLGAATTGRRVVTVGWLTTATRSGDTRFTSALTEALGRDLRAKLGEGDELFVHSVHAMRRYRLRPAEGSDHAALPALAEQTATLLGSAHDVLLLEGRDGVPVQVDRRRGDRYTLWVAFGSEHPPDVQVELVRRAVEPAGFVATPIDEGYDSALAWLLDVEATTGLVAASRSPQTTTALTGAVAERLRARTDTRALRAGPKASAPSPRFATLDVGAVAAAEVDPRDLAYALDLLDQRVRLGNDHGTAVHLALPGGAMAARHGDLPIATGDGERTVALASLRRVADTRPTRPILRLGRWPGLYLVADTSGLETWVYVEQLRDEMARVVEPSDRLDVRTLILNQAPLSRRRQAR